MATVFPRLTPEQLSAPPAPLNTPILKDKQLIVVLVFAVLAWIAQQLGLEVSDAKLWAFAGVLGAYIIASKAAAAAKFRAWVERLRDFTPLLALCLALAAPLVQAQEATVFDVPTRAQLTGDAEVPRLVDYLSLQASGGVALRGGQFRPLVTGLGLVHLARFGGQGPILSAALGGQAVLGDAQDLGFFGGLALDLPGLPGQRVQPSLALGAGYSSGSAFGLSTPGWFSAVLLGFRLYPGG